MGTIAKRTRKDGTVAYQAQILIKRGGSIVHRETRTFDREPAATVWMSNREKELAKPGAVEALKVKEPTLSHAIDRYTLTSRKEIGRTKAQVLKAIQRHPLAEMPCSTITSVVLMEWAEGLAANVQPQTVGNYLAHLRAVFAIAEPAWGYKLDMAAIEAASKVSKRLGITAKSRERTRRPTLAELDALLTHFTEREARGGGRMIPMGRLCTFALFSTRRLSEITRMRWEDLDLDHSRLLVRDMKNPGEKLGNDVWVDLVPEALAIVRATPRTTAAEIFPFSPETMSTSFTRACALLGIEDLHCQTALERDPLSACKGDPSAGWWMRQGLMSA